MFLHTMVSQNPKKPNAKETTLLISYNLMLEYICAIYICHNVLKNVNILKK
jgi:hypothetical protein